MTAKEQERNTMLLMILTTMFWGGSFVAGKIALPEFPPMTLTFFRYLLATAIIFPYMWSRNGRKVPERKDLPLLFMLGLLGISGYFACQFTALIYTSAANASTINALNPLVSSLIASVVAEEILTQRKIGLILFALSGVLLTITGGDVGVLLDVQFNKGDLIMMVAMVSFAVYGVYSKRATQKYSPLLVTTYVFLFGLIQITPLMFMERAYMNALTASREAWVGIIFMAIGSSVLGYLIQQVAIQRIGISNTSLFINLVPIFATVFAFLILGEPITIFNIISACIIGSAVYLNTREC
jgi:drug/metabolite transporter (DMT)-like permease